MTSNNDSTRIDIGPSSKSQADLQKFLKLLREVEKTAKDTKLAAGTITAVLLQSSDVLLNMKKEMKEFALLANGMKRNAISQTGEGAYTRGQQFRTERGVERTARAGTGIGQDIALQKEGLALAREGLKFATQRNLKNKVFNLDLQTSVAAVRKINSIEQARALAQTASLRRGGEIQQGNEKQARQAERIQRLAEARVRMLQKEATAVKQRGVDEKAQLVAIGKSAKRIIQDRKRAEAELASQKKKAAQDEKAQLVSIGRQAKRITQERMRERTRAIAQEKKLYQISAKGRREAAQESWRKRNDVLRSRGGADLFGVQARVMANFALMNAGRSMITGGIQFSADLDESLRNLQAITVITDDNLESLKGTILDVSEETKFFATDIANAAVTLGQAGFSVKEIQDSVRAVALLATATGTDLARSVDLTTSILGVFSLESTQMTNVANTLTAAVNNSKLNIDKLALGLQYAGNTAAQSGVNFEELTASLGAMANAGIRSGSTLGTGMRQILIALQKPSGKFKESLDRLGLTMADVDLRANGLYGVMKNLSEGGFTAGDAIRSFAVRAAASFNALAGNLDDVVKLERAFLNSSAAMAANETQMRALTNQGKRFQANLQAVISSGLEPMVVTFRDMLGWVADGLQTWREYPEVLRKVITGFASLTAGLVAMQIAWLSVNVLAMITGVRRLITTLAAARLAGAGFSAALLPMGAIVAGLGVGLAVASAAFGRFNAEVDRSKTKAQKMQTEFDNLSGDMEETASRIEMVSDRIKELSDRSKMLDEAKGGLLQLETDKVREQFGAMGLKLGETVGFTEELVAALRILRSELAHKYVLDLEASASGLENLIQANEDYYKKLSQGSALTQLQDPITSRNFNRLGYGQVPGLAAKALDPNASPSELRAIQSELTKIDANAPDGLDNLIGKPIEKALEQLEKMIQLRKLIISQGYELNDINEKEANRANLEQQSGPGGVVSRIANFRDGRDSRISAAAGNTNGGKIERYDAAQAELKTMQSEAKGFLAELDDKTLGLNEKNRADLRRSIENALATAELIVANLGEVAKEAAEDAAEVKEITASVEDNRLSAQMKLSENEGEIQSLGNQRLANVYPAKGAAIDALNVEFKNDTTSELYKTKLLELEQKYAKEILDISEVTNQHRARVKDLQLAELHGMIKDIERDIDQSTSDTERAQLRKLLVENYKFVDEIEREKNGLLIEGAEALAIANRESARATQEALDQIKDDGEEDMVDAAERDLKVAENALTAVQRLAKRAITNKDLAEAQFRKAAALAVYATAVEKLAQVNTDAGDGTEEENAESARESIAAANDATERAFRNADKRINKKGKGGGNPYKKKRDYIDQLIDDLEAKLTVAENYLDAGQVVSGEYDGVMEAALSKVSEIGGQIDTLQTKLSAKGLTVQEQERLNVLIDQQARMTTFIKEEEMRIALIKLKQGEYTDGILGTTRAWVAENLDLSKTLQDGITNSLGTAKSAMVEFFNSMAEGTKTGAEAFRGMAVGIIKSIQNIFAELLAVFILKKALGWIAGGVGGGVGEAISKMADGLRDGGEVKNAAQGEHVKGNLNRDSQRYNLMPGEYVLRRSAVQAIGVDELDKLNAMGNNVASQSNVTSPKPAPGVSRDMNIYLVDERSKAGSLGPGDVIAVISDDIARGGTTKKLIKSVQMGAI